MCDIGNVTRLINTNIANIFARLSRIKSASYDPRSKTN